MEIKIKNHYGIYLIVEAENVHIEEAIEDRKKRDIDTSAIDMIINVLRDIMDLRESEYDSSDLIEELFDKLPEKAAKELLQRLNKQYSN